MPVSRISLVMECRGYVVRIFSLIAVVMLSVLLASVAYGGDASDGVTTYYIPADYEEAGKDVRANYFRTLLALALDQTIDDYGPYRLVALEDFMYQDRAVEMLGEQYQLDILWTMTSRERELKALPIRIPLMKGLLGVRVLVVRKADLPIYQNHRDMAFLKSRQAVQGHDWPDTQILRSNALSVEGDLRYQTLFQLISMGRYDYFPRGLLEADTELKSFGLDDLAVVPGLVLTYPSPIYFFVRSNDHQLAQRLEAGLRRITADGEFDRLLREFPGHREGLARLQHPDLKVIRLSNPLLPDETPLDDPQLWFDPSLFNLSAVDQAHP